jgi:hypothetical protein
MVDGRPYAPTLYADSLQLAWACKPPGQEFNPVDLARGISQYVDVLATVSGSDRHSIAIDRRFIPLRYADLFSGKPAKYRFTIVVAGNGVTPVSRVLMVDATADWEKVWAGT